MTWQEKPIWKSRTLLSLAIAVVALVAKWFGIDVDLGHIGADHVLTLGELVSVVFIFAAKFFRIQATGPLTYGPKPPPAP